MASLVDTPLVCRSDGRFAAKQRAATKVLRAGIAGGAVVEFVAAVTRPLDYGGPLLDPVGARRGAEELLRGASAYQLSWFDAHMWTYAERYGLGELLSEDFQHGRLYGTVEAVNPFVTA